MNSRFTLGAVVVLALLGVSACSGQAADSVSRSASLSDTVTRSAAAPEEQSAAPEQRAAAEETADAAERTAASPTRTQALEPEPADATDTSTDGDPETATRTQTQQPTQPPTETATEVRTETATQRETATQTKTARETTTETATVTAEPTKAPTPSASPASTEESGGGVSPWVWVLLLAVIVGVVVALVMASRRRKAQGAWDDTLGAVVREARWLAHEFLPTYEMQDSDSQRSGMWTVSRGRAIAIEHAAEALVGQADDPAQAQRAANLLGAVRRVRIAIDDAEAVPGPASDAARILLVQSQRELVETLRPFETPPQRG